MDCIETASPAELLLDETSTDQTTEPWELAAERHGPAGERQSILPIALALGTALFASGAAGLVNQVVWQRSLKVFLGGSDTICSMIVVLVFMAGLGIGSLWMGRRTSRLKNPLGTFGQLELLLAVVNAVICGLLASDISRSVFHVQQTALTLGIPLLAVYGLLAVVILFVPCFLMGTTLPLAAEACQRNLRLTDSRLLGLLFFINTLGSVLGTVVGSGSMMPLWGMTASLLVAAGMNALAGGLLLVLWNTAGTTAVAARNNELETATKTDRAPRSKLPLLAFGLGFCSLAFEMYLFRLLPLRHEPLPFTFASVLTGFLLFWSVGAALSARSRRLSLSTGLRIAAGVTMGTTLMFVVDTTYPVTGTWSLITFVLCKTPYFLPCLCFGYLYGLVTQQAAQSWGRDVGRIAAWNTAGSCLGVVLTTLIGYELPFFVLVLVIALLLSALQEVAAAMNRSEAGRARWVVPLSAAGVAVVVGFVVDLGTLLPGGRMYSGRDGVIVVEADGDMVWDGLWHSKLSHDGDHIGTNNWQLAVCPALWHPTGEIVDVCVIGVATGITATTLSRLPTVETVDAYDISRVLKRLYEDFPQGTLGLADNPKIDIIWQDARTGLTLNPKQYDLIQAQPLYLKQAGSGLLNSVEFYRLVASRLKPGGVFCLYSNGTPEQAFIVRETANQAFPYAQSFFSGYLVVLSNEPILLTREAIEQRLARRDPFWDEVRNCPLTRDADRVLQMIDQPPLEAGDGTLIVTDDHPLIEYPEHLKRMVQVQMPGLRLPAPLGHSQVGD